MSIVLDEDLVAKEKLFLSRWKFGEEENVALLKEVVACGAHVSKMETQADKFEEVAKALNAGHALPWATDGKHSLYRFKLLVSNFKMLDRARVASSGCEEEYGEKDQLLCDMCAAMDDAEERFRAERSAAARNDAELVRAGREVRASAMNRRSSGGEKGGNQCAGPVDIDTVDDMESQLDGSPRNASNSGDLPSGSTSGRKRKRSTSDLEEVIASAEERRADQESLRLKLKAERLDFDRERAAAADEKEERKLKLIEQQHRNQHQQQQESSQLQLKIMSVLDEMLKSIRR